jgi:hypothetical protein
MTSPLRSFGSAPTCAVTRPPSTRVRARGRPRVAHRARLDGDRGDRRVLSAVPLVRTPSTRCSSCGRRSTQASAWPRDARCCPFSRTANGPRHAGERWRRPSSASSMRASSASDRRQPRSEMQATMPALGVPTPVGSWHGRGLVRAGERGTPRPPRLEDVVGERKRILRGLGRVALASGAPRAGPLHGAPAPRGPLTGHGRRPRAAPTYGSPAPDPAGPLVRTALDTQLR